jgi:hypothetical protein
MALETAVLYLVALALPVWLMVEEVVHRDRRRAIERDGRPAPSTRRLSTPDGTIANRAYSR